MILVFEGIDGTGKTTQALLLKEYLESTGREVRYFKFPSKPMKHDFITGDITCCILEQALDKFEHYNEIAELSKSGCIVIIDRWFYSGVAYQSPRINKESRRLCIDGWNPSCEIVFYFDTTVGHSYRQDEMDLFGRDYMQKVLNEYDRIGKLINPSQHVNINWITIDATESIEHVHDEIVEHVERLIKERK